MHFRLSSMKSVPFHPSKNKAHEISRRPAEILSFTPPGVPWEGGRMAEKKEKSAARAGGGRAYAEVLEGAGYITSNTR